MQTRSEALPPIRLVPITPSASSRYCASDRVWRCPRVITRGPVPRPSSSSDPKWTRFVHPEGQLYFVLNSKCDITVVTEANINDTQTENRILDSLDLVNDELQSLNIKPPSWCELLLELGNDHSSCNYYFVDHAGKGLFWLEDTSTESFDIPAVMSSPHLERALEQLYWKHVEFFPMHHKLHQQEFSQIVDDLYNIISHGQADRLTSKTSTFPYEVDTCSHFLKLLSRKRGQSIDGYTLCYAARLAEAITNQRFVTFYGERPAQLDRLQEMCPTDAVEHRWLFTTANSFMWGIPQHYTSLLEDLFVNEQVYVDQWTHFLSLCLADWTSSLTWSFPVFISSILLANVRGGTVSISMPSVLSCIVSIASASCLHLRYQPLAGSTATVGASYLRCAKSDTIGFLPTSAVFSLPRASYLWGLGFLAAQFIFIIFHSVSRLAAVVSGFLIAALFASVLCVIYPEDANTASLFRFLASLCNPRLYARDARTGGSVV